MRRVAFGQVTASKEALLNRAPTSARLGLVCRSPSPRARHMHFPALQLDLFFFIFFGALGFGVAVRR